jgi:hypothetical protein
VYATLKTDKNVFYSAYLSGKIQYNDMDKDKDADKPGETHEPEETHEPKDTREPEV